MKTLGMIILVAGSLLVSACVPNGAKQKGNANDQTQHSIAAKRTRSEIQHAFETIGPKLVKAYQTRLRQRPDLAVKLELMLTIEPDGKVHNVRINKTTAHDPLLESNLIDIVSHMNFGPVRSQKALTLTYPMAFVPK